MNSHNVFELTDPAFLVSGTSSDLEMALVFEQDIDLGLLDFVSPLTTSCPVVISSIECSATDLGDEYVQPKADKDLEELLRAFEDKNHDEWRAHASCNSLNTFDDEYLHEFCGSCPVRIECLDDAMSHHDYGTRGNLTEDARNKVYQFRTKYSNAFNYDMRQALGEEKSKEIPIQVFGHMQAKTSCGVRPWESIYNSGILETFEWVDDGFA